jgi:D-alanine-D-alanine ligase
MKVAVLLGGYSSERDVSIASGAQVVAALRERGHEVLAVDTASGVLSPDQEKSMFMAGVSTHHSDSERNDPSRQGVGRTLQDPSLFLRDERLHDLDLWFLALHGGAGEDGRIQALLSLTGIPYTGSGVLGSALAMDKDMAKRILVLAGVQTPKWLMAPASAAQVEQTLGWPVVVKPSKQGSTVGLSLVRDASGLQAAIDLALEHDDEVMLEQFIPGREYTCPVLEDRSLAVGEIALGGREIFDYEAKYQSGIIREIFPAELPAAAAQKMQQMALQAHQALKLKTYSRSDFRLDAMGGIWCLEVNTLPGLTRMSLVPQSAAVEGISFAELVERICQGALQ